ncbi:MAG TPA: transcriptional regulator [Verrucomicrobia bacterium]|nr:MAG: transcriptional regulator [Lentisphaerae bacterium GWF2_57_35]HBA86315.1 transcriptional regulator [Verrucomicrobiota bacterium]
MKESAFNELVESIKQAGEIRRGQKKPSRVFRLNPPNVKTIRKKLHVTQSEFARLIGVSVDTLQNWEQGRREPEGPARALLTVAAKNPKAVLEALHA